MLQVKKFPHLPKAHEYTCAVVVVSLYREVVTTSCIVCIVAYVAALSVDNNHLVGRLAFSLQYTKFSNLAVGV